MAEPGERAFEITFSCKNMGPRLFDAHRLFRILFPFKAQARIGVCPFRYAYLKRGRNIIENTLAVVEKFLILLLHLRT